MGYTTTNTSMFSPDMPQTPENVRKVLDIAGWTVYEASEATGIPVSYLADLIDGEDIISDDKWRRLLDVCGRRSFDHDEGSL